MNIDPDIGWPCLIILVILSIFTACIVAQSKLETRLMSECMADGKKEYECRAMIMVNQQ